MAYVNGDASLNTSFDRDNYNMKHDNSGAYGCSNANRHA